MVKGFNQQAQAAILGSGLLGGVVGWTHGSLQWAVELAQFRAGVVLFPSDNLLALTQATLWSAITQLSSVALTAGVPEETLSRLLSAALGSFSFQALSLFVLAISSRPALAFCAAPFIFLCGAADYGVTYPVALVSTPHTYGALGLSFAMAAAGYYACGWRRVGMFLLGLAPAVHVATGAPMLVLGLIALFLTESRWRRRSEALTWAAAGLSLSAVSWGIHAMARPALPAIDSALSSELIRTFATFWDVHRQPVRVSAPGVIWNLLAFLVAVCWLRLRREDDRTKWVFTLIAITSVTSLVLAGLSHLPVNRQAMILIVAIPARMLNLIAAMFAAVLIAAAAVAFTPRVARVILSTVAVLLVLSPQSAVVREFASVTFLQSGWFHQGPVLVALAVCVLAGVIGSGALTTTAWQQTPGLFSVPAVCAVIAACLAAPLLAGATREVSGNAMRMSAQIPDLAMTRAAQDASVLLTGGDLWLVQLRTRRPVLIEGGTLDTLPYTPALAPRIATVLQEVYELDVRSPPDDAQRRGSLPNRSNRIAWEAFDRGRWQGIARAHGVSHVLVPSTWRLALPLIAASPSLSLYVLK